MSGEKKMAGPLGLKMSEEEANKYLIDLLNTKEADLTLDGMELQCLQGFKSAQADLAAKGGMLNRLRGQIKELEQSLQELAGRRKVYVEMLIAAEEGRRNKVRQDRGELELIEEKVEQP